MRALSWFMSLSLSAATLSGFAACSPADMIDPRPGSDGGTRDAAPPTTPTGSSDADGGPAPENKGLSLAPRGIVLANATRSFAAFRLCKARPGTATALSLSASQPIPTTLMPRANVSGVDVASAVTVDPLLELDSDTEVIVLKIDETTKTEPGLETSACRQLACVQSGGQCLGPERVRRVRVATRAGEAPIDRPFTTQGTLLVLRDDGSGLRLEASHIVAPPPGHVGDLDVAVRDLSLPPEKDPELRLSGPAGKHPTSLDLTNPDWTSLRITYGAHSELLSTIHESSDPRRPLAAYFAAEGPYVFLLFDAPPGATTPKRFVAVPMEGFPKEAPNGDAGLSDGGPG
ncbi:MAG: hypothetical protein IPK71_34930 [Myxococcales bacterium]|nr:hypothetical protein [Myxococcales bacterium]